MAQSKRLSLNPHNIACERGEDAGSETRARAVPDCSGRQLFAAQIEIAVFRQRAKDVDGPIDLWCVIRRCMNSRYRILTVCGLGEEAHHTAQDTLEPRSVTISTFGGWPTHRCHDSGGCTPPGRQDSSSENIAARSTNGYLRIYRPRRTVDSFLRRQVSIDR